MLQSRPQGLCNRQSYCCLPLYCYFLAVGIVTVRCNTSGASVSPTLAFATLSNGRQGTEAMQIITSRFGLVEIDADDVFEFPAGLIGLEGCRKWVLLADAENSALGWLQSTERPDVALATVSPLRYVEDFQIRVTTRDLAPLRLNSVSDAQILAIVSKNGSRITANLKAPLVFHLERRIGLQVVTRNEQPLQHELPVRTASLRRSA